jgi:Icc-related predicted phosphoesterase
MENKIFRLAAMADLHCKVTSAGLLKETFSEIADRSDALALCGDLVDYGLPEEAEILLKEMAGLLKRIPVIGVLGNHEFECGKIDVVRKLFADRGMIILDGDAFEIDGVGFAGVKGFAGGFGERVLEPWGEAVIKRFVREALDEALKLESALARLRTPQRIALLHYAPIAATIVREPPEIFPFLGCSRLEEPLNRYSVTAVFHGHAHRGSLEGRTKSGAPVYNVAMRLLESAFPTRCPYRILELPSVRDPSGPSLSNAENPCRVAIS